MKQEIAALQASKKKEFSYFVKFDAKWQTAGEVFLSEPKQALVT